MRQNDQTTIRAFVDSELSGFTAQIIPRPRRACSDRESGLKIADSVASRAYTYAASEISGKPAKGSDGCPPYHDHSTNFAMATVQHPPLRQCSVHTSHASATWSIERLLDSRSIRFDETYYG